MINEFKARYGTDFIILGPLMGVSYANTIYSLAHHLIYAGPYADGRFLRPDGTTEKLNSTLWFSTIKIPPLKILEHKEQDLSQFKSYDNFDALHIDDVRKIPLNYDGAMVVPITFAMYYREDSPFEVVQQGSWRLDGKEKFRKLLIRRKRESFHEIC